jgi:cell division protein FtsL
MSLERTNAAVAKPLAPTVDTGSKKKKQLVPSQRLTVGEKIVYLCSIIICVMLALTVLSRYAKVIELKVSINKMDQEIKIAKKENNSLEAQRKQLESIDHIRKFADAKGLELINMRTLPLRP